MAVRLREGHFIWAYNLSNASVVSGTCAAAAATAAAAGEAAGWSAEPRVRLCPYSEFEADDEADSKTTFNI